jgi:hypothetical protein
VEEEISVQIDARQAKEALGTLGSDNASAKEVMNNAELLNLFVGIVNGSLAALDGKTSAVLGIVDKHASLAGFVGNAHQLKGLSAGSNAVQILTQTLALLKLGSSASPGMVVATVGAMFTKKAALAFGMVEDDKRAKIIAVATDCVSSFLSVGIAAAMATNPVGWVLLAAAAAQAGASAYQAYAVSQQ